MNDLLKLVYSVVLDIMVKIRLPYMTPTSKVQLISPKKVSKSDNDCNKLLTTPKWRVTHSQQLVRSNDIDTINNITFNALDKSSSKPFSSSSKTSSISKKAEKKLKIIKKVSKPVNMDEKIVCNCGGYYSNKIYYGQFANSAKGNIKKSLTSLHYYIITSLHHYIIKSLHH